MNVSSSFTFQLQGFVRRRNSSLPNRLAHKLRGVLSMLIPQVERSIDLRLGDSGAFQHGAVQVKNIHLAQETHSSSYGLLW